MRTVDTPVGKYWVKRRNVQRPSTFNPIVHARTLEFLGPPKCHPPSIHLSQFPTKGDTHSEIDSYKVIVAHKLKLGDPVGRLNFCQWFQKFIIRRIDLLDTTFFGDEVWFYLRGYVNTQNTHYWSFTRPNQEIKTRYKAKWLKSGVPFPDELLVHFFHNKHKLRMILCDHSTVHRHVGTEWALFMVPTRQCNSPYFASKPCISRKSFSMSD